MPTAIGLSALLVSTSKQMPLIINELSRRKLNFPVLIGGAAINQRFGRRILLTDEEIFYEPGVFYCKDAFEGLSTMDALTDSSKKKVLLTKMRQDSEMELGRSIAALTRIKGCSRNLICPTRFSYPPSRQLGSAFRSVHAAGCGFPAPFQKRTIPFIVGCEKYAWCRLG